MFDCIFFHLTYSLDLACRCQSEVSIPLISQVKAGNNLQTTGDLSAYDLLVTTPSAATVPAGDTFWYTMYFNPPAGPYQYVALRMIGSTYMYLEEIEVYAWKDVIYSLKCKHKWKNIVILGKVINTTMVP